MFDEVQEGTAQVRCQRGGVVQGRYLGDRQHRRRGSPGRLTYYLTMAGQYTAAAKSGPRPTPIPTPTPTPTPSPSGADTLLAGNNLESGNRLASSSGYARLEMQASD